MGGLGLILVVVGGWLPSILENCANVDFDSLFSSLVCLGCWLLAWVVLMVVTPSFVLIFCGGWVVSSAELVLILILHKVTCSVWLGVVGGVSDFVPKALVFVKIGGGTSVRLRSHL